MNNGTKNPKKAAVAAPKFHVDENHCFNGMEFTVNEMQEALSAYRRKKKSLSDWLYNDKTPIFVDANVILEVYFTPVPSREHLSKFLKDNRERLYMTSQVEREFIRHRLEFIDKNKGNVAAAANKFRNTIRQFDIDYSKLFKELKTASVNSHFVDSIPQTDALINELEALATNEHLLSADFYSFQDKLNEIGNMFDEEFEKIKSKVDIEFQDPILAELSKINILSPLCQTEYDYIRDLYFKLRERYDAECDKLAPYLRFPGSGEDRDTGIKEEPWSDLVIYHQVLSFMADNHKDVIFLTNDKTKQDWMKKDFEPYSYYIADAYKNTGQTLFIISKEKFLPNDYKSIDEIRMDEDFVGDASSDGTAMSILGINGNEISTHYEFKAISSEEFLQEFEEYSRWADTFGEKYVSKSYFIYVVLGHQGYRYSKNLEMLDMLVAENKLEIYNKEKNGITIPSIRFLEQK